MKGSLIDYSWEARKRRPRGRHKSIYCNGALNADGGSSGKRPKSVWIKPALFVLINFMAALCFAQEKNAESLHASARDYMKQGDYTNAILVLNNALKQEPENLELLKDQAFTYYLQRNYSASSAVAGKLLERKDADVKTYQIAAMAYKATDNRKELDRLYKKGLKAFPNSGILHNEYGEVLWSKQDYDAIKQWEKGIEVEPNYPGNYYNAARYYYFTQDKVWSILYGEVFINMESYTNRTVEMKNILLNSYKKFFADTDMKMNADARDSFVKAFISDLNKQATIAAHGITPESLIMIRTRFILQWYEQNFSAYPFRLFAYHQQLLQEGLFEAYNHWLFGSAQNLTAFQNWTNSHADVYKRFIDFQKGRVFKMSNLKN